MGVAAYLSKRSETAKAFEPLEPSQLSKYFEPSKSGKLIIEILKQWNTLTMLSEAIHEITKTPELKSIRELKKKSSELKSKLHAIEIFNIVLEGGELPKEIQQAMQNVIQQVVQSAVQKAVQNAVHTSIVSTFVENKVPLQNNPCEPRFAEPGVGLQVVVLKNVEGPNIVFR
ncbi:hypothetical protein SLEP1_g32902 [Rubroshorea leprosula]|uniref:Uncharacterized protein n=1 Tax=Rubroshorea leprosula TaxID=152421 RepID=A0AAV5KEV6_9ROSI|nr:hypothetical protein SLEP1_g32902 [Rubroshorea leprosula]